MSRKKLKNLVLVFWGGLFLLTFEPVFIWLLVGSIVLLGSPCEKSGEHTNSYTQRMKKDAKKHQLKVPANKHLRGLLKKVYKKQEDSFRAYPHLKAEYEQITDELWIELSQKDRIDEWSYLINSVLDNWPGQQRKANSANLGKKLEEVRELTRQWNEAKNEALGGQHV